MFKVITKKVFKGTDEQGRQVLKAIAFDEEEKAEIEGIISYTKDNEPLLTVTSKTIFDTMILKLEPESLQKAHNEYAAIN
ncbi:MAG: hypothetical protein Q9M28_02205 [Mariprofundaceae bacterium]|nr:hypothetical protein [Mariprofundaceae bacterium]